MKEKNAVCGVLAGLLWVAGWLMEIWLSWVDGGLAGPYIVLVGEVILAGWLLSGQGMGRKLLWAVPAGAGACWLIQNTGGLTMLLNAAFPGYGRMSAGGGFGVLMVTAGYGLGSFLALPVGWMMNEFREMKEGEERK